MLGVTFKQLQAFVILARELNFGRAAEHLHVTAPTITATIKNLESTLGLRLFDRSTRSVMLTTHAEHFLPIAERLLDDLSRALGDLKALGSRRRGSVVAIGATSFITQILAPAVAELASSNPDIKVRLIQESTTRVAHDVLEGKADFGITALKERVAELASLPLIADRFGIVCHRDHPISRQIGPIELREAAKFSVIGLNPTNGLQIAVAGNPRIPAAFRTPLREVSTVNLMSSFLEQSMSVALLPALSARILRSPTLVFLPVRLRTIRKLQLVVPRFRSLTPAAQALIELMYRHLKRLDGDPMLHVTVAAKELKAFTVA